MRFSIEPPYSSRAPVGQRRDEAREQVAVRHVDLEHVEARLRRRSARDFSKSCDHLVHVGARHLARHLRHALVVRDRRSGDHRPVAASRAGGPCAPSRAASSPCGPEWPSCMHSFAFEFAWQKSTMRLKASRCASFHRPVQPGEMRASGDGQVISTKHQARRRRSRGCRGARSASRPARRRPREYWSIGETTTRFSTTMSRRRNGVNIGTGGFVEVDVEALLLHLAREPAAAPARRTPGRAAPGSPR